MSKLVLPALLLTCFVPVAWGAAPRPVTKLDFGMEVTKIRPRSTGHALYILEAPSPSRGRELLHLWNLDNQEIVRTYDQIPLGIFDFAEVGGKLCVSCRVSGVVAIVDPVTGELEHTVPLLDRGVHVQPGYLYPSSPKGLVLVLTLGARLAWGPHRDGSGRDRSQCLMAVDLKRGTASPFLADLPGAVVSLKDEVLLLLGSGLYRFSVTELREDPMIDETGRRLDLQDPPETAYGYSYAVRPGDKGTLVVQAGSGWVRGVSLKRGTEEFLVSGWILAAHPKRSRVVVLPLQRGPSPVAGRSHECKVLLVYDGGSRRKPREIELQQDLIRLRTMGHQHYMVFGSCIVAAKGGDRLIFPMRDPVAHKMAWWEVNLR
jgi:hypothetical protein